MSVADDQTANPVDGKLAHYNAMSPEVIGCPFHFYKALHEEAPVYEVPGAGFWIISRYEDVKEALKKPELFSNEFQKFIDPKPEVAEIMDRGLERVPTMLTLDPPLHRKYRSLVNKAFTAPRVKKMEGYIQQIIDELVADFIDDGHCDLTRQFGIPLPMSVIADQLGVPRKDMMKFKEWSDAAVIPFSGIATLEMEMDAAHKMLEFQKYIVEKFHEKQANPGDDMISVLATAHFDDEDRGLTDEEFFSVCEQLLVAGNETTTNTISAAMLALIENPDQMQKCVDDPDLIPNMVEEVLRLETPVQGMWRVALDDAQVAGVTIPKGSLVNLRYAAANQDEAHFPEARRMDVTRGNAGEHFSFGRGTHMCIGQMLARKEVELAFRTLLSRMKNWRLAAGKNDFDRYPSFTLRGLKALHLEFDRV